MKKLSMIAALCVFAISSGMAQQRSTGDGAKEPVAGILIGLEQPSGVVVATTRSDANGRFSFGNIAPGDYVLKIGGSVSQAATREIKSPRDVATGQASGKRQYEPVVIKKEVSASSGQSVQAPRDPATGQATGKRVSSVDSMTVKQEVVTARETGSGMATGKVTSPRDPASGLPTGKSANSNDNNPQVQLEILDESAPMSRTINTSRSNIKSQRAVSIGEGTSVTVGSSGQLVGNVLKTKHDTVKNSINNVR